MTDPVDTDALRDVTRNEGLWEAEALLITAAADEIDRLRAEMVKALLEIHAASREAQFERERAEGYEREMTAMYAVIENAPHTDFCVFNAKANSLSGCTCWKADAL